MTKAQTKAMKHPCRLSIETLHPRFRRKMKGHSLIITINTGYE